MIAVINGEPLPEPDRKWERSSGLGHLLPILLVAVFVASGVLRAIFGRLFGSIATGGLAGGLAWLLSHLLPSASAPELVAFLFAMLAGSTSRGWSAAGLGEAAWGGGFGGGFGGGGGGGGFSGGGGGGGAAAPRGAGDAVRAPHTPRRSDALAHAHVVSPAQRSTPSNTPSPRRECALRRDSFRHRNRVDAAAHSERRDPPRARARGVRTPARVGHRAQQRGLDLRAAGGCAVSKSSRIAASKAGSAPAEWEAVCRLMEEHFRTGRFKEGSIAGSRRHR